MDEYYEQVLYEDHKSKIKFIKFVQVVLLIIAATCLFARKVILGYKSIVEMNIDEEKSIKNMLYMIQLIMMKYFIKNNYEYIADVNIKMINYISEVW